jgi:hypothetical protein
LNIARPFWQVCDMSGGKTQLAGLISGIVSLLVMLRTTFFCFLAPTALSRLASAQSTHQGLP